MIKIFKKISVLICVCLIVICALSITNGKDNLSIPIRDIDLTNQSIDYENEFSKYNDAKLEYSKKEGYVAFSGIINYSSDELFTVDFVSITSNSSDVISIEYDFNYDINSNLFYMNVEATNTKDGKILDCIVGVPFKNENGEIDIVFDVDGRFTYLSELTESKLLENCGWFSKILKKVGIGAAVVAVASVVVVACVYAAPAVIAVATSSVTATTFGTTAFITGSLATSTLATCASIATTTTLVAGSIAAIACLAIISNNILNDFNKTLETSQA